MRIDTVHINSRFKNLEHFTINLDENAWETVLLGLNATGKSNFLEALVIIFRDLDLIYNHKRTKIKPPFDFYIKYECKGNLIEITLDKGKYSFTVEGKPETTKVTQNIENYLPKHVFIYYSGTSDRLAALYNPHQKMYYDEIIKKGAKIGQFDTIRRIFLVQNIHANFALIAFYLFKEEQGDETIKFLKDELKIIDFGSALFMLKKPIWALGKKGTELLWGSTGLVRDFLDDLLRFSFAPIQHQARVDVSYKNIEKQERIYLYLRDRATFADLVEFKYKNKISLFNALESLHISDMIHDVKIKVKKENVAGELAMSELSEGEKQLLTVLGLLKFTRDDESLILLDEPDTHLNPMWKWKFLDYLDRVVKRKEKTQIIFCSHDPLVIGNLLKSQVQLFKVDSKSNQTITSHPKRDPKGLGVAGILTSDMFDLPTTLDSETQSLLNERNNLLFLESEGKLDETQETRLGEIYEILNGAGFSQIFRDPLYTEFVIAYQKALAEDKEAIEVEGNIAKSKAFEIVKKMISNKS